MFFWKERIVQPPKLVEPPWMAETTANDALQAVGGQPLGFNKFSNFKPNGLERKKVEKRKLSPPR